MTKLIKIFSGIALVGFMTFFACNKSKPQIDEEVLHEKSSVTIVNGKYNVDSTVIYENRNKKMLLDALNRSYLAEKKDLSGIPTFIKSFLDSISDGRKFEIANPGENWVTGIMEFGSHVLTKVYDPIKKDSVMLLVWDGKHYPNKQMAFFGIGKNIAILSYYTGAWQQMNVIKFEDNKVVDFWYGGFNPLNGTNRAELIKQIKLAGTSNGGGC